MELPRASTDEPGVIENVLFDPRGYGSEKNDNGPLGWQLTCQELKGSCPVIQRQSRSLGLLSELLGKRRQLLFFGKTRARWEA